MVSLDALFGKPFDRYVFVPPRCVRATAGVCVRATGYVSRPVAAKRRWAGRSVTIQEEDSMTAEDTMARWRKQKPYMLTQDELLSELAAAGADVTLRQLRDWTYEARVLPHPVKRKPPGATTGGARALYPLVAFYLALDLARGRLSIADARASLQERTTHHERYSQSIEEQHGLLPFAVVEEMYPGWPRLPMPLRREASAYADRVGEHLRRAGEAGVQVHLRICVETAARKFETEIPIERPPSPKERDSSQTGGGKH